MAASSPSLSLSRRLVTLHLAFGLGGLLLCLLPIIVLQSDGQRSGVLVAACLPVILLAAGAQILHRSVSSYNRIDEQLHLISAEGSSRLAPEEVAGGNDAVAQGWNAIVARLAAQESITNLERRLTGSLAGRRDGRPIALVNNLPDGVALTEQDGTILLGNRMLAALAQVGSTEELIGRSVTSVLNVSEAHNGAQVLADLDAAAPFVVAQLQRSLQLADGLLRITRQLAVDSSSPLTRYVWTVRDVTQSALVEEARHQFLALATHELRTPLTNIKAYAETLAIHEGIDVEQQKEFCNIINAEATRLSRFVDEMLSISQIESGAITLDMQENDLPRMLNDVIGHATPLMIQKSIIFETKLPPKLPSVRFDKAKLHAALVNLLGNAAKYTPEGGRVWLELRQKGAVLEISVRDSGIGITEHELPKVFERFFRSADSRVSEISGNGLGLTFSKEVIQLHGGALRVTSQLNEGTEFIATLPVSA